MKLGKSIIFLLVVLHLNFPLASSQADSKDKFPPVKMKFANNSLYPVSILFFMQKTLVNTHFLKPGKTYETTADHSMVIQLEYSPVPYKTILKPIDSENELSRTITFTNDGEHVRIKEKFIYKKNAKINNRKKKKKRQQERETD